MDLRDHPRYEVALAVTYSGDQVSGRGMVTTLSQGGCGIKADATIPIGAFLDLSIDLPAPQSQLRIDLAVVRWSIGKKFGLDFLQMHPNHETRLRRFIKSL